MRPSTEDGKLPAWSYSATTAYNQIPSRSRAGVSETFGYDTRSRMTTWTTSSPATTRTFSYDGAGRLRKVARTGNGPANEVYRLIHSRTGAVRPTWARRPNHGAAGKGARDAVEGTTPAATCGLVAHRDGTGAIDNGFRARFSPAPP